MNRLLLSFTSLLAGLALIGPTAVPAQTPMTLDTSFGTNGTADPNAGNSADSDMTLLALLRTDQFVGITRESQSRLRRILPNGLVESGNAHEFLISPNLASPSLVALPDGQVIACGTRTFAIDGRTIIRRTNLLGGAVRGPTEQFLLSPFARPPLADYLFCRALDQHSRGRLVVGASYAGWNAFGDPVRGPALRWLRPDGQPDSALLGSGAYFMQGAGPLGPDTFTIEAVGESFNGSTLVAARYASTVNPPFYFANDTTRIRRIGAQGVAGDVIRDVNSVTAGTYDSFTRPPSVHLRLLPNEDFQVFYASATNQVRVERYSPNGLTLRFGRTIFTPSTHDSPTVRDVAMRPDGSALLLVSAKRIGQSIKDFWIAKTLDNGFLDPNFTSADAPGLAPVTLPASIGPLDANVGSIAIDRQGRILTVLTGRPSNQPGGTRRPFLQRRLGEPMDDTVNWPHDLLPDPMTFPAVSVRPGELATSDAIEITGLSPGVRVPLYVLDGEYSHNGTGFGVEPRMVGNFDRITLRGRAPTTQGGTHLVRLHVGGVRGQRSWESLGPRVESVFAIQAVEPALPGDACVGGPLNTNCTAVVPPGGTVTSTINRIGDCPWIRRVRVGVDVEAQRLGDLRIVLEDPNAPVLGTAGKVMLLDRPALGTAGPGSCNGQDIGASFADYAAESAAICRSSATPAITGAVRPAEALGSLVGRAGTSSFQSGIWKLVVRDVGGNASARIRDWSVEVDCAANPPSLADLDVAASGPGTVSTVAPTAVVFTVTNQGPSRASNALFSSELAQTGDTGWSNPSWTCSASAGSACGSIAGCPTPPCTGHLVRQPLDLQPGGSASITISATSNQGSGTQSMTGAASLTPSIAPGAAFGDPVRSNDESTWSAPVLTAADLRAIDLAVDLGPGEVGIQGQFDNLSNFTGQPVRLRVQFPPGYTPIAANCVRGPSLGDGCSGDPTWIVSGQTIELRSQVIPTGVPHAFRAAAAFTGSPPPGTVTFTVDYDPGSGVVDPGPGNNQRTFTIPPQPPVELVFRDDFEN